MLELLLPGLLLSNACIQLNAVSFSFGKITFHAGMSAGVPKYITVNLSTLSEKFTNGEEVSLETLTQKRMLNLSGKEAKLPLKVLSTQKANIACSCGNQGHSCKLVCLPVSDLSYLVCASSHMQYCYQP